MEEVQYYLNPSMRISPLDVGMAKPHFLLEIDGRRRFEVSAAVHRIIQSLERGHHTAEEIARELSDNGGGQVRAQDIKQIMSQSLVPKRIVFDSVVEDEAIVHSTKRPSSYLSVKVPLVSPDRIKRVTQALRWFFHQPVFILMLTIIGVAHVYFYTHIFANFHWAAMDLPLRDYFIILAVLNVTTIWHELGHASACRRYNCPHGEIGWGIYLYMFVLYTDVTSAWRLKQRQRAMVDFGGMYFEMIAQLFILGLMYYSPNPLYIYIFVLLDLSVFHSLNPIFRRDGYWLVSDLVGIANLRATSMEAIRYFLSKATGKQPHHKPRLLALNRNARVGLYLYTVLSVLFFFGLVYWLVHQIVWEVIPGYPKLIAIITGALGQTPPLYWDLLSASGRLLFYTLFVGLILISLIRFLKSICTLVKTLVRSPAAT